MTYGTLFCPRDFLYEFLRGIKGENYAPETKNQFEKLSSSGFFKRSVSTFISITTSSKSESAHKQGLCSKPYQHLYKLNVDNELSETDTQGQLQLLTWLIGSFFVFSDI